MQSRVSKRIQSIVELVDEIPCNISSIWDTCCDHGQIGHQLLLKNFQVQFLDQVSSITEELAKKLAATDIPERNYSVHTQDIRKLDISNLKPSCFILVGIGADLIIESLKCHKGSLEKHWFVLSAHQNNYKLRRYLKDHKFKYFKEILVKENNQFYEILLINQAKGREVELIGQFKRDTDFREYAQKMYQLFNIKAQHDENFLEFYSCYKKLLDE